MRDIATVHENEKKTHTPCTGCSTNSMKISVFYCSCDVLACAPNKQTQIQHVTCQGIKDVVSFRWMCKEKGSGSKGL